MTTADQGAQVALLSQWAEYPGGPAVDLAGVTITITRITGAVVVVGPTGTGISHPATGVYTYTWAVPAAQTPGDYLVAWSGQDSTGDTVTATELVTVTAATPGGDFITVSEAKTHLKLGDATPDAQLQRFVSAACTAITDRMGQVSPLAVVADRHLRRGQLVLPTRPVISITSVQRLPGLAVVPQADTAAGVQGWTLTSPEGVLEVTGATGPVRVTYQAGRSPLPANFRLACLELVGHLWRGSQHNQAGRPGREGDAIAWGATSFAMPYRVMELLGLKKNQERDEILVF